MLGALPQPAQAPTTAALLHSCDTLKSHDVNRVPAVLVGCREGVGRALPATVAVAPRDRVALGVAEGCAEEEGVVELVTNADSNPETVAGCDM